MSKNSKNSLNEIELAGFCASAGKKEILHGIDLSVKRGEFITILGPNGSGKTTLLKSLIGLGIAHCGGIKVAGLNASKEKMIQIRNKCAYLPQGFDIDKNFPVLSRDIVNIGGGTREGVEEAVRELKIETLMRKPFGLLSGGEKQKVLLAMVLSRRPSVLLMDEPNLNLDPMAYAVMTGFLQEAAKKHSITVLFVTHLASMIPVCCVRAVVLKEGKIVYDGSSRRLMAMKKSTEFIYG